MRLLNTALIFTILFITTIVSNAQQPENLKEFVAEIYKQIPQRIKDDLNGFVEKDDTATVNKLITIGYNYNDYKPDSAVIYALKSLAISKRIHYNYGTTLSYQVLINKNRDNGDFPAALNYMNSNFRFNQEIKDTSNMIFSLNDIALLWLSTKNYRYAIENSNKALSLINIFKNWKQKDDHVNKEVYKGVRQELMIIIGKAYTSMSMKDSALFYLNRAYEEVSGLSSDYDGWKSAAIFALAEYSYQNKDYELAIGYLNKNRSLDNLNMEDEARELLYTKIYINMNKAESALKYLKMLPAYIHSTNKSLLSNEIDRVKTAINCFKLINNKDSILKYQNVFLALKDTAYNQDEIKRLEAIKIAETVKDYELQEKQKQEEKERSNNIKLGAISIFIPTFTAIVFYLGRRKSKNTKIFTLMGLASLLMLFEFISLLIHPYVEHLTNHDAILMYLILLILASILVPIHHKLETWVKEKI